jgi:hypothetical protein
MNTLPRCFFLFLMLVATASAEVTDSAAAGFVTAHEVTVEADRDTVWRKMLDEIGGWWSSDHTISGDASRLSITALPQGCFCEDFGAGAGVVHLTVTMVNPGVVIRLSGGLGPLGLMGVNGNMTWELEDVEDGTKVKFTYAVGGYMPGGLDTIAGPVDAVIGDALARLKGYVETGDSPSTSIE